MVRNVTDAGGDARRNELGDGPSKLTAKKMAAAVLTERPKRRNSPEATMDCTTNPPRTRRGRRGLPAAGLPRATLQRRRADGRGRSSEGQLAVRSALAAPQRAIDEECGAFGCARAPGAIASGRPAAREPSAPANRAGEVVPGRNRLVRSRAAADFGKQPPARLGRKQRDCRRTHGFNVPNERDASSVQNPVAR